MKRFLFWTPRVLCLLFAGFVSLFALDVFGEGRTFWQALPAFFIHLVPTYLILLALLIAWRWEWVGTVLFAGLGAAYIILFWGRFPWMTYLLMSGPLFLMSGLFLMSWKGRGERPLAAPA
jgi:hypothetical protein